MGSVEPRIATLVLCTAQGEVLGALPPFTPDLPWWQDAAGLVRGVEQRYQVSVTILRLLRAEKPAPPGGSLVYLAEVDEAAARALPLTPWADALEPHPLRLPYAQPGGPARDVAWAGAALAAQGLEQRGRAEQVRTWNLSSLWRIPVDGGNVWLKRVPPFFAHEGSVITALGDAPVPRLLAHEDGRILMAEIPGEDLYEAGLPTLLTLVSMLVDLQVQWIGRDKELLALGLPDWRPSPLQQAIESVARRSGTELSAADQRALADLTEGLRERFALLEACGVPDSIVHGDFAPGNARGDGTRLVLLDWGDCGVGHPLLDHAAFTDRIGPDLVPLVRHHWDQAWQRAVPGSDPEKARALLAPVAAARQAVIYQGFLDQIEPSEHPYHRGDPAAWLTRAAALTRVPAGDG